MSTATDVEDTTTLSQITTIALSSEESPTLEISTVTTATHGSSSTTESPMEAGSASLEVSTTLPESSTMTEQRTASSDTTGEEPTPASETISTTYEFSTTLLLITPSTEGVDSQTPSGKTTQPSFIHRYYPPLCSI